jgi:hypothetical protein
MTDTAGPDDRSAGADDRKQTVQERVAETLARIEQNRVNLQRQLRFRAAVIVGIGAIAGTLLILASVHLPTGGFLSVLCSGLGAGALTAALVAAFTPYIAGLWHTGAQDTIAVVLDRLERLSAAVSDVHAEIEYPGAGRRRQARRRQRAMERIYELLNGKSQTGEEPRRHIR